MTRPSSPRRTWRVEVRWRDGWRLVGAWDAASARGAVQRARRRYSDYLAGRELRAVPVPRWEQLTMPLA